MSQYKVVFSPTGGTQKVADILAAAMGGQWQQIDLSRPTEPKDLAREDVCLIAVPSFGGLVPEVALQRLKSLRGNGARAVLVCAYGNRLFEDTLTQLQDAAEAGGFVCAGAVAAVAEHSIMRQFAAGRPDDADRQELEGYAQRITQALTGCGKKKLVVPGSYGTYKERGKMALKPAASEACVACGACARGCPVGAIDPAAPNQTNQDVCITCMRCVAVCPVKARALDPQILAAVSMKMRDACGGHKDNYLYIAE